MEQDLLALVEAQRAFFQSEQTREVNFRIQQLKSLKRLLQTQEKALYAAIHADFGKSDFDTFLTELSLLYLEINFYLKHLKRLSRPQRVRTNLPNWPAKSRIYKEPLGCALIISAWNYPYQLALAPAVSALAAGNTCLIKPSELAGHTAALMATLINTHFPTGLIHVVTGGAEVSSRLLEQRFDKIFFTGSPRVGKIVYEAAAKHLCPVTLELGGKSPVIVLGDANLRAAARRIVWGKFLNAGQTCIAPDFLLVESSVKEALIRLMIKELDEKRYSFGDAHFPQIINEAHTKRLQSYLVGQNLVYGGQIELQNRHVPPCIVEVNNLEQPLMQEEIFGPILPVVEIQDLDEALQLLKTREKPLSAYLFTESRQAQEKFLDTYSFGGGCINDTIMHVSNPALPFGGVGVSGMGNYHGEAGFRTFSHEKSVLIRGTWFESLLKYPPYTGKKLIWIRKLLGFSA